MSKPYVRKEWIDSDSVTAEVEELEAYCDRIEVDKSELIKFVDDSVNQTFSDWLEWANCGKRLLAKMRNPN